MSYLDDSALYRDNEFRQRAEMCTREQAFTKTGDPLAAGITGGDMQDIDAMIAAVVTMPGAGDVANDDQALLSATQAAWDTVSAARYPQV